MMAVLVIRFIRCMTFGVYKNTIKTDPSITWSMPCHQCPVIEGHVHVTLHLLNLFKNIPLWYLLTIFPRALLTPLAAACPLRSVNSHKE